MRYISFALLLLLGLTLTFYYGTAESSCELSGKRMRDLMDLDEQEGCSRDSYPKVISETVEALAENAEDSDDADRASNVPQESFFAKLRRAFQFAYKIIKWLLSLAKE